MNTLNKWNNRLIEDLENPKNALSSEIYGEDGVIIGKYYLENRTNIRINDISPEVIKALIATELLCSLHHSFLRSDIV